MLAIDPERLAARIGGNVVVAPHLLAVPPSSFDSLGAGAQCERTLKRGIAVLGDEAMRTLEQPRRTRTGNRAPAGVHPGSMLPRAGATTRGSRRPGAGRDPISFRPVIVRQGDAE